MMASPPNLDHRLRTVAGPLPDTDRALSEVMRRVRRRTRRRVAAVVATLAIAASLVAAVRDVVQDSGGADVAVRATDAPSETPDHADDSTVSGPRFPSAPGWVISRPGLTAASIPLGPHSLAGQVPWDTVERLDEDGEIVLFAMLVPVGETSAVDAIFPRRKLPLSLDDAEQGGLEGQPDMYADRLLAQVNGWNIDLLVFYGGTAPIGDQPPPPPSAEARAAAQEQLARLVVPAR